jgi:hypothetical protein
MNGGAVVLVAEGALVDGLAELATPSTSVAQSRPNPSGFSGSADRREIVTFVNRAVGATSYESFCKFARGDMDRC